MRGFHDEMGGPESIASPSEWGELGWGDGMTAAGLPAAPELCAKCRREGRSWCPAPSTPDSPSEVAKINGSTHEAMRRGWLIPSATTSPSDEQLRHDYLLRRHIFDTSYGVVPGDGWRERCLTALRVPYVGEAPLIERTRVRRNLPRM